MSYLQSRSQMNGRGSVTNDRFNQQNQRPEPMQRNSYDYSSNDEDDEDEEERLLSEIHGEAADDNRTRGRNPADSNNDGTTNPKKRKSGDSKDIDEQYRQLASKRRIPRPKLTAEMITGVDGLIRIPTEFSQNLRSFVPKNRHDIAGAAAFSRALIRSYERFTNDLFPSACPEDVYYKIEQLGSSKMCRDYLQHMRTQQRNQYLEKALGKERAIKIIDQFDDELRLQQQSLEEMKQKKEKGKKGNSNDNVDDPIEDSSVNDDEPGTENGSPVSGSTITPARNIATSPANTTPSVRAMLAVTPNPYASNKKKQQNKTPDDGEYEATFNEGTDKVEVEPTDSFTESSNSPVVANPMVENDDENEDDVEPEESVPAPTAVHHRRRVIEDSDDEESVNELLLEEDNDNNIMSDGLEINHEQLKSVEEDNRIDNESTNSTHEKNSSDEGAIGQENDSSGGDDSLAVAIERGDDASIDETAKIDGDVTDAIEPEI